MARSVASSLTSLVPIRITARSASGRVCFLVASTRWVVVYIWSIFTTVQLVRGFLRGSIMCLRLESAMRFILILVGSTSFFFSLRVAGLGVANSAFIFCSALSFSSISRCSCCFRLLFSSVGVYVLVVFFGFLPHCFHLPRHSVYFLLGLGHFFLISWAFGDCVYCVYFPFTASYM